MCLNFCIEIRISGASTEIIISFLLKTTKRHKVVACPQSLQSASILQNVHAPQQLTCSAIENYDGAAIKLGLSMLHFPSHNYRFGWLVRRPKNPFGFSN